MLSILRLLRFGRLPALIIRLMLDRRTPLRLKALMLAALVYVLSPVDFMPEVLAPFIGFADDLIVALAAIAFLLMSAPRQVIAENFGEAPRQGDARAGDSQPSAPVIEGEYRRGDDDAGRPQDGNQKGD